jgi:hypothetical protein
MKRLRIIIMVVMILLVGWLVVHDFRNRDPQYEGRTLSEWLEDYQDSTRADTMPGRFEASTNALKHIGTNAIPTLLRWAAAKDIPGVIRAEGFIHSLGWENFHISNSLDKHSFAYCGFQILGQGAMSATPALVKLARTGPETFRLDAAACLIMIEPDKEKILPVLNELLEDPNEAFAARIVLLYRDSYPEEAEKADAYKRFPALNPTNSPMQKK